MSVDRIPDGWRHLIAVAKSLEAAPDATTAVVIEALGPDVPYNKVLSCQQAWVNKYQRCAARGLMPTQFRIRRNRLDDGGYEIEAVRDLTPLIETAMVLWPGEQEVDGDE